MLTAIPDWVFNNVVESTGITCPKCGEIETRSWYE